MSPAKKWGYIFSILLLLGASILITHAFWYNPIDLGDGFTNVGFALVGAALGVFGVIGLVLSFIQKQ